MRHKMIAGGSFTVLHSPKKSKDDPSHPVDGPFIRVFSDVERLNVVISACRVGTPEPPWSPEREVGEFVTLGGPTWLR